MPKRRRERKVNAKIQQKIKENKGTKFDDWVNNLPSEARVKLNGEFYPATECARTIIIRNDLPRNKFATVICLALPPRAISELEALVPEFVDCGTSY